VNAIPHLPAFRLGREYSSLDRIPVTNHRTAETVAEVSSINAGIIRKDMKRIGAARAALKRFTLEQ